MNKRERKSWPETAMFLAESIASLRSEDPYIQVGACVIHKSKKISLGYNGPPPSIEVDYSDRDARRYYMLHAEANVLDTCEPGEIDIMAVTHLPCSDCLKRISKYKIEKVFYKNDNYASVNIDKSIEMAKFLNIQLIKIK